MNRINNDSYNTKTLNQQILDKNILYTQQSTAHENYWFQDLSGTLFNLDYVVKIFPTGDMTYPEKINALVRLSIYIGVILALFYSNFLFLYIPIVTMLATYILYLFRIDQLENTRATQGANAKLYNINGKCIAMQKIKLAYSIPLSPMSLSPSSLSLSPKIKATH